MKYPVLLPNIFDHPFTYESDIKLNIGQYVEVPFGKNTLNGVVWDKFEEKNNKEFKIKKIIKKLDIPKLSLNTINFFNWFSEYNLIPKGMSLKLHLLSKKAVENNLKFDYEKYNFKTKIHDIELSDEQKKALINIDKIKDKFRVHVLQGTTGSGKTYVYFQSIKNKIREGYQCLILLPEIGLTFDFEKKFENFFGFRPAIWNSQITKKNKKIIWNGLALGKIKVVIGARSSLFLPFKNLGEIIVDEEHDQSYKQDEGVTYNARDMAVARAQFENIPINLVSAVPSIETYENIQKKKYSFSRLINRYKNYNLPKYEIINLNQNRLESKSWISPLTKNRVHHHLLNGDQVLFFLNRRGYSPYVICKNCHKVFSCPNCSINLVYHLNTNKLICHYCGYKTELQRKCSKNVNCDVIFSGPGVERISEEVKKKFPKFNSVIFSSDTMSKKSSKETLKKIINNDINILVGTQLISKGFHFPNLNCIIVLDIDLSSMGHDLRSSEKNLQLYHQLSGRAGRAGKPATVYFQTYDLNSKTINQIVNQDPFNFLENELEIRKKYNLPPYERFIAIILTASNEKKLFDFSNELKNYLSKKISGKILGPVQAPIYKIKKKYRNRLLIRASKSMTIQNNLSKALKNFKIQPEIKLTVDVDPISFN